MLPAVMSTNRFATHSEGMTHGTAKLNLGILAHVDAGKTTLTERLLFEAGVITEIGSVDAGTTHPTRLRSTAAGITINSAVAAFSSATARQPARPPGHPDFIAEVDVC